MVKMPVKNYDYRVIRSKNETPVRHGGSATSGVKARNSHRAFYH